MLILSLLTTFVGCGESGDDLVVLQNGGRQTGKLQGCVEASCQLNGNAIPRATIAWIGLAYAGRSPPAIRNAATDEVDTRSVTAHVHSGRTHLHNGYPHLSGTRTTTADWTTTFTKVAPSEVRRLSRSTTTGDCAPAGSGR